MKRAIFFIFIVCESRSRYISTESKLKVIPKGSSSVGKVDCCFTVNPNLIVIFHLVDGAQRSELSLLLGGKGVVMIG